MILILWVPQETYLVCRTLWELLTALISKLVDPVEYYILKPTEIGMGGFLLMFRWVVPTTYLLLPITGDLFTS